METEVGDDPDQITLAHRPVHTSVGDYLNFQLMYEGLTYCGTHHSPADGSGLCKKVS